MSQSSTINSAAMPKTADYRGSIVVSLVLAGLVTWLFWDFLSRQVRWAWQQPADWGHTLVIPFIAWYFVYLRRDDLLSRPFKTTWIALVPILVGLAWYMLCVFGPQPLWHHNLRGAGFAVTLFGLVLLFCGWRAMLILWFPLAYLVVFGQTISDQFIENVTFKLQDWTAVGSEIAMRMIGMDVQRDGNTLTLLQLGKDPLPMNIAEACSGMRMLMAFLALGVAISYTGLKYLWQRALLVSLALPTALVVNIMRVVTLGQLSRVDPNFTVGEFHTFVGLVWLVPAFLIYLGLVWIIRRIVVERPSGASSRKPGGGKGSPKRPQASSSAPTMARPSQTGSSARGN